MVLIGHLVLFVLAALSGYLLGKGRAETLGLALLFGSAVVGIFLFDLWVLVTVIVGAFAGNRTFAGKAG